MRPQERMYSYKRNIKNYQEKIMSNVRPENMERITTAALAQAFIDE